MQNPSTGTPLLLLLLLLLAFTSHFAFTNAAWIKRSRPSLNVESVDASHLSEVDEGTDDANEGADGDEESEEVLVAARSPPIRIFSQCYYDYLAKRIECYPKFDIVPL
ncbi:unnamed protein product [Hydatigera taeniaeformis]|uniref:Expressed conserved protein n=1 Tax=Hydatigena taeniaeformis TaxID=6205 RepID=A0A0R3X778_HYDTA|nr:unnamed protein product [Hydatigera taeniaeformis]